ncbi:MAG: hypothetical protein ACKO24_14410 [Leptolyngbyaceae cyanobacterium]
MVTNPPHVINGRAATATARHQKPGAYLLTPDFLAIPGHLLGAQATGFPQEEDAGEVEGAVKAGVGVGEGSGQIPGSPAFPGRWGSWAG